LDVSLNADLQNSRPGEDRAGSIFEDAGHFGGNPTTEFNCLEVQHCSRIDGGDQPQHKNILRSNIYSPSEGVLLKWVSIHHCAATGDLQNPVTSFYSLEDGIAFGSLLKAHTSVFKGVVIENPTEKSHREQNTIELASSLKELKLRFSPRAEELVNGSPPIVAMSLGYFYETLPYYLPMMNLQFVTTLHKALTKPVSISNPSKAEILYKATLEGNQNYALTMDSIIVPQRHQLIFQSNSTLERLKLSRPD
jgi:hypothetical protein